MKNIGNGIIVKRSANAKVAKPTQIENKITTSMTKLKEQNTLLSSLQQNVTKLRSGTGIYLLNAFCQIYLTFA